MRKTFIVTAILAAAAFTAACNDRGSPSNPPAASCPVWTAQWSRMETAADACITDGFNFPVGRDGVHYLVRPVTGTPSSLHGKTVTLRFAITGTGTLVATGDPAPATARIRLYVQNRFDNMQGPFGRWWSRDVVLVPGDHVISYKFTPEDEWSSVFGQPSLKQPDEFNNDVKMAGQIGFTLGGEGAGHGVYAVGGPVRFSILEFSIK